MADIQITDISNGSITTSDNQYVWTGTGIFDRLMSAINGNIKVEYDNGRINSTEYATVYLGALQSAIAASMDYLLREKLIEAQISDTEAAMALKQEQIAASQADTAIKQAQSAKDLAIKDEQILKLQEEVDLLQTQDSELQLNGVKDRLLKDEQVISEQKNQLVKDEQAMLIARQATAYDDNLRVEEAKARKDVIFSYNLGGQTPPTEQIAYMNTAIDAIAP